LILKSSISFPSRNPQLECLPNLYRDLQKVFQFQKVEKVPQLVRRDAKQQPIRSGEQEKTSDEADSSGSDSDGDPQSDKGDCFYSFIWK
jgi:hypothetical protein